MSSKRPEDADLVPDQFPALNRTFFTQHRGPHVFLEHRLRGALLAASDSDLVKAVVDEGVTVGDLTLSGWSSGEPTRKELDLFAALEATVLFHHAAETLLRLTLALENDSACPWLEVARLRRQGVFPKAVDALAMRLDSDSTQDALATIFYARRDRTIPWPGVDEEVWIDAQAGLTALLAQTIRRYRSEATLYNSAKHGLSAVQGEASMRLGDSESPLVHAEGHSLTYLDCPKPVAGSRSKWHQTTRWVDAPETLAHTFLIASQIRNLWTVARVRYVNAPEAELQALRLISMKTLDAMAEQRQPRNEDGYSITTQAMSIDLAYFKPEESSKMRPPPHRKKR